MEDDGDMGASNKSSGKGSAMVGAGEQVDRERNRILRATRKLIVFLNRRTLVSPTVPIEIRKPNGWKC